jgi:SAM-dependent methyltransferase
MTLSTISKTPECLLCGGMETTLFYRNRRRSYYRCRHCALIFVPPEYHLTPAAEEARYRLHHNEADQAGYRAFLQRIIDPLVSRLPPGAQGIDYGSGPGGVLAFMLGERGFEVVGYDPFFADDPDRLGRTYDFLTCSEVFEHLRQPTEAFSRMITLVRPGGWLAVMTQLTDGIERFGGWHYSGDPTHIGFYAKATFRWLADRFNLRLWFFDPSVMLYQTPSAFERGGTGSTAVH